MHVWTFCRPKLSSSQSHERLLNPKFENHVHHDLYCFEMRVFS
uniref:Uncharacterized protein n=1 Tax=Rhizophora mucronata TaxID=61149 RepID=A0A2P2Q611_RHIMU